MKVQKHQLSKWFLKLRFKKGEPRKWTSKLFGKNYKKKGFQLDKQVDALSNSMHEPQCVVFGPWQAQQVFQMRRVEKSGKTVDLVFWFLVFYRTQL